MISCDVQTNGQYLCGPTPTTETFAQSVTSQMDALKGYFTGPVPLYRVVHAGVGCFELTQVREYPSAPYGTFARMCFDPADRGDHLRASATWRAPPTSSPPPTSAGRSPTRTSAITQDPAYDSHYDTKPGG